MNNARQRSLLVAGFALFVVGLATTIGWNLLGWVGGSRLSSTEFPLGDHLVVAVDSLGRIYVGDAFYGRVQRYSPTGRFECGWFVDTNGAVFALATTADNRVEVAPARREGLLTYSASGQLLGVVKNVDMYLEYVNKNQAVGQYAIKGSLLPSVRDERNGQTIITTPWTKRLVSAPFPSLLYSGLGIALIAIGEWQRRRGRALLRAKQTPSPSSL